jgi:hypothetical protein
VWLLRRRLARFATLVLLLLPLSQTSCYTQVRDPSLTAIEDPTRSDTPRRVRGPSEGTLVLVVDYATMTFERWVLVSPSPRPAAGRDLEIQWKRDREFQTVSFRYPETEAMIFQASAIWGGTGRIEFPDQWRPYDTLPRGGGEAVPTWMRVYSAQGPGEVLLYEELPYAHEAGQDLLDLWYAISDRELVSDWVEKDAWVGVYLYRPSPEIGLTYGAKWIVFIRG